MYNQNHDRDEFEWFLQDALKDFRMTSGRRVWKSLYNNLHPNKRWPAFSTVILFICCLSFFEQPLLKRNLVHDKKSFSVLSKKTQLGDKPMIAFSSTSIIQQTSATAITSTHSIQQKFTINSFKGNTTVHQSSMDVFDDVENVAMDKNIFHASWIGNNTELALKPKFKSIRLENCIAEENNLEKEVAPSLKKFSTTYYLTPSVGYRKLNRISDVSGALFPAGAFSADAPEFFQKPSLNMEIGMMAGYSIQPNLTLLAGIQLAYMGYRIEATEWEGPVTSELEYIDPETNEIRVLYRESQLAKVSNGSKVRQNYSVDLSIPLGLNYTILNQDKWQWSIQGTIQPGIKISDKSALLSANQTSYIYSPEFTNRFTLHAGLSTQISIPINETLNLSFGPSARYQVNRQYRSNFVYRENRFNGGITVGLVKSL
jgi:hypothetical protein